jgi:hypothetical protein
LNVGSEVLALVVMNNAIFGYNAMQAVESQLMFQRNNCFMLVSCLAYSLTLKMEVICSSKTLVNFQGTIEYYIPEDT